ncbi:hypothetical protein HF086_002524 [Spodoptera exigua]|uniref:Uncharacterized protein n=1 Tax=Spodoptera exigua TaxID=7107 RepID=A0A922M3Z2_SPOEX|nr:hypothetical protein HF086_002524 [Spodoptera exigua]
MLVIRYKVHLSGGEAKSRSLGAGRAPLVVSVAGWSVGLGGARWGSVGLGGLGVARCSVAGWLHSLAGLVKRRLSGYVKWHHLAARRDNHHPHHLQHRWGNSESWSMPASPLPPRAPPPRPAD